MFLYVEITNTKNGQLIIIVRHELIIKIKYINTIFISCT